MKKTVGIICAMLFVIASVSVSFAAQTYVNAAGAKVACARDEIFTPQKKLQACILAADTTFGHGGGGQVTCQAGQHINFDDRGIISTCTVARKAKNNIFQYGLGNTQVTCQKGETIVFSAQGRVEECVLAANTVFKKAGTNMATKCKGGGVVVFDTNGGVQCR
jgi:hypothetical protein